MAVVTNNMSTYDATSIREDLSEVISNLTPKNDLYGVGWTKGCQQYHI